MKASDTLRKFKIKTAVARREAIKEAADQMAVSIREVILLRTRFEGEGVKGKLAPLADSTISQRERYSGKLSSETDPRTSNLTATGQLLNALSSKRVGSKIVVEIKDTKRKKTLSGGKDSITNKQLRKYVEEAGREFLGLTSAEKKEAMDLAVKIIAEEMKKALNKT